MDGEDRAPVVHAGDRVHAGAIKKVAPECSAAGIGGDAGGQNQSEAAARSQQLQRTLDEQLIPVGVSTAVDHVDTGLAEEPHGVAGLLLPPAAGVSDPAVAPDHVPRGVADDGVESTGLEDLGKRERPVQESLRGCDLAGMLEEWSRHALGERRPIAQELMDELAKGSAIRSRAVVPEPAGAPQIQHTPPSVHQRGRL